MSEEKKTSDRGAALPAEGDSRQQPRSALPGSTEMTALLTSTTERVREVLEATEQAAEAILEDARRDAQRHVEESRRRAEALARERVERIASLTEDLLAQAERAQRQAETFGKALAAATSELAGQLEREYGPLVMEGGRGEPSPAPQPSPNGEATPEAGKPAERERALLGRFARRRRHRALADGSEEAVRVMAMQMSSAGLSREQISERLASLFDSEQAGNAMEWLESTGGVR